MNSKRQKVPLSPEIDFVDITQAHRLISRRKQ